MKRLVSHVVVWTPIIVCIGVVMRVGVPAPAGMVGMNGAAWEEARDADRPVTAIVRSAPQAAEAEGGMPVGLVRLIDDPPLARGQIERVALLYRRWSLKGPSAAARSALAEARLLDSDLPLRVVLEEWLATDPESAMAWATDMRSKPGDGFRVDEAIRLAVAECPVETRAAWAASIPDDPGPVARVAAEWVIDDPDAAVAWLAKLRPGLAKSEGLRALVGAWMRNDSIAAGGFVATLPAGRHREIALAAAVASVGEGGVAAVHAAPVPEDSGAEEWLVGREAKAETPRVIRRLPAEAGAR